MSIQYNSEEKVFHIKGKSTSYIIQILKQGYVSHVYWGKSVKDISFNGKSIIDTVNYSSKDAEVPIDSIPQEYATYGNGDFRTPTIEVQLENGSTVSDLRYHSHRIFNGKTQLENLPATYIENEQEAETLEITVKDSITGLKVVLSYTVYNELDVITRSAKIINESSENMRLIRALSINVDFNDSEYDLLQLSGAWCRERHVYRRGLVQGIQGIDSKRGISSHQHNPFIALLSKDASEINGEAYGFSLVYSGNFLAQVEVNEFRECRVSMGLNPFDFTWLLEPQEAFQTPEVVMVYSDKGVGEMSRKYHKLYKTRLCRGKFRDEVRPILINNWEATYFNFNEDKIKEIAKVGAEVGIELFVLDDGWFGKRDSDKSSLGDWVINERKLPNGLNALVNDVNNMGMKFGLWFEPEMVSPNSDLFREHPDWCVHVPNRKPAQSRFQRNQLVLDLSREEVCNEIIKRVSHILSSAPISYVKWDMNRAISDMGSPKLPKERQREFAHRYVLGLYRVMNEITEAFPDVLFESCCSGGGRFDPGILYYMPQTWTSDDTDAIERLKIQYGTSIVYPQVTMGAHISTVPNHQVDRVTTLETRATVAMSGTFGYELDLTKFTEEEKEAVKEQIKKYKDIRHITQFGDYYRILSPFSGNETAWISVIEDKTEAYACYVKVLGETHMLSKRIKLQGLNPDYKYEVVGQGIVAYGDELMNIGLDIGIFYGDFISKTWWLKAIK